MSGSAGIPLPIILLVQVPLLLIWAFVLVDIVRQPQMRTRRKVLWALACTVIWPAQLLYLLIRPQRGRAERALGREDTHARLVDAALDREDGRIDADTFARIAGELRRGDVTG